LTKLILNQSTTSGKMVARLDYAIAKGICTLAFAITFYEKIACSYGNVKGLYIHNKKIVFYSVTSASY